jgi:hypothetical protein
MPDKIDIRLFNEMYPDEASCIQFLEESRWPDGQPISPITGAEAYKIATRPGVYKCRRTGENFSIRRGTIFEGSRLPLKKWFFGTFLLHSLKDDVSSVEFAKYLGITQCSAWFMMQRIKHALSHAETPPLINSCSPMRDDKTSTIGSKR